MIAARGRPRRPARPARRGTLLLLAAFAAVPSSPAGAQQGPAHWDPDERVLIADFGTVTALARRSDRLFAATSEGLLELRDAFRSWEPPLTREDGWPAALVTAMAWHRPDRTLWIAVADGRLLALDADGRRWTDEIVLGERVSELVSDEGPEPSLLLRGAEGWRRLDPFSRRVRRATAAEAAAAVERSADLRARRDLLRDAGFASQRAFIGTGPDGERYEITDVMPSDDPTKYWVGTAGGGLVLYDTSFRDARPVPYGLQGEGAAAIAADGDGVWIAPWLPRLARYGVTRVSDDLEQWRIETWRTDARVPDRGIRALVESGDALWSAGERGLHRRDASGRWTPVAAYALLGDRLLALAWENDGEEASLWIGGERGLARARPPGPSGSRVLGGVAVAAVHAAGGVAWAATDRGLLRVVLDSAATSPRELPLRPAGAVTGAGDTVWAGVDREVWRRSPAGGWNRVEAIGLLSAPVTALAVRDGVLWAGTSEELAVWDAGAGLARRFTFAGGDLPLAARGERAIFAIVPVARHRAWLALPAGALRLDIEF
ncbi:MAG: hypothetical protein RRA92_00385 [Gemmatimonadota bacterium]|nr:hypothetical protein [Gemmatimonadota bacterium]